VCVYGVRGLCWLAGNSSNRESYGPHNGYGVGNAIVRIGFSVPVTPITNRVFSTVSEQAALCRIYRRGFDCILALLAVPFLVALKLIEQCPVNTLSFRLANWALPDAAQRRVDLRLLRKMDKVFDILNVLLRPRKEKSKLLIGRLEEAERAIQRTVDNLYVLRSIADPWPDGEPPGQHLVGSADRVTLDGFG
jgi:hypothetical protein